jgi:hypothetical protein
MPTLDDAPKTPRLATLVAGDLVQIYDVSAQPTGAKTITAAELLEQAVGLLPTSASGLAVGDLWLNSGVVTRKMS